MNRLNYLLVEELNFFILRFKRNKIYPLHHSFLGINLGCEYKTPSAFVGIDGSSLIYLMKNKFIPLFVKKRIYFYACSNNKVSFDNFMNKLKRLNIIHHNMVFGIPFKDSCVKNIFSSNFLEHLNKESGEKLLKECYRVLIPNGRIRIVVPDLDIESKKMEDDLKQYKQTKDVDKLQEYFTLNVKNKNYFSFHKRMYNFEELKNVLQKIGFKNVQRFNPKEGDFPLLENLDPKEGLIVQAEK